ncbi:MAG: hypothetical protein DRG78_09430 [Epsilonproteobacteria bacterium]|nr:MAG: hypothetical protein DRG78_09430 [Campylobacterota bacterium]
MKRLITFAQGYSTLQLSISAVIFIMTLVGGFYGILVANDRWDQSAFAQDIKQIEENTIKTFELYQMKQKTANDSLYLKILDQQLEYLDSRYYNLKRELRKFPNDTDVIEDLKQVSEERCKVRKEKSNLLESIIKNK